MKNRQADRAKAPHKRNPTILAEQKEIPDQPVVTILCVTFNHANFIRDALEGFLMQAVTFGVEILIHDDASTDGTQEIVKEYADRYPQLIRAILQTENQFSKGVNVAKTLRQQATGRYIAYCEGDDYWTDPHKIALQAAYLDAHPDIVMCGHKATILDVSTGRLVEKKQAREERSLTALDVRGVLYVPRTCTRMVRRIDLESPPEMEMSQAKDAFLQSLLGRYGGYQFMKEVKPSVYRVHRAGLWSGISLTARNAETQKLFNGLIQYHSRIGDHATVQALEKNRRRATRHIKTQKIRHFLSRAAIWKKA